MSATKEKKDNKKGQNTIAKPFFIRENSTQKIEKQVESAIKSLFSIRITNHCRLIKNYIYCFINIPSFTNQAK